jgi:cytochrome c
MSRPISHGAALCCIVFVSCLAQAQSAFAVEEEYKAMDKLAKDRGCSLCHSIEPRKPGAQEVLPVGPAWKSVAQKYKGRADAVDSLTRIVLQGTGPNSADRHWKGNAAGAAMLPNAVEINEAEAGKLVRWILSLDK